MAQLAAKRTDRIAQEATEKAWHKVNRRIISFESFCLAVKPEIVEAIRKAMMK